MHEKSRQNQSVTEWYGCYKCGIIDTNTECLCCCEVEAVKYFKLLGVGKRCHKYSHSKILNSSLACEIASFQLRFTDFIPSTLFNINTEFSFKH